MGSFFPFQTTNYLNVLSFMERELERANVGFRKNDNAFLAVDDEAHRSHRNISQCCHTRSTAEERIDRAERHFLPTERTHSATKTKPAGRFHWLQYKISSPIRYPSFSGDMRQARPSRK